MTRASDPLNIRQMRSVSWEVAPSG